jgi:hypothetical protein
MKGLIFRAAMWACPAPIRQEYASEMEEVFFHCLQTESARRRGLSRLLILPRGLLDLLMFAAGVRRDAAEADRARAGNRSPLSRMYRSIKMRPQDVRSVLRLARKQPFFSAAVVLMLALGLGASTAIFSVVYGVLLKPLPFPESERIVQVWGAIPARQLNQVSLTEANFWDMRDWNRAFEEFGALHAASSARWPCSRSPGVCSRRAKTIRARRLSARSCRIPSGDSNSAAIRRSSGGRFCSTAGPMPSSASCRQALRGSISPRCSCRSSAVPMPIAAAGSTSASAASNRA